MTIEQKLQAVLEKTVDKKVIFGVTARLESGKNALTFAGSAGNLQTDSQFFIVFDDATFLDRKYTVWGRVIDGMDNVDKINRGEPPRSPDKILSARVASDAKA